jgi:hypothetical protein
LDYLNERQKQQLLEQIKEGKAVIVTAKHGMGKTTFIKRVVLELGWELNEIDVSAFTPEEWEELYDLVSMRHRKSIIYIPTIDRVKESRLLKLVRENYENSIILETSMTWGFKELKAYCREISLEVLDWRAMTGIMKERGTYSGKTPQNLYHAYGDGDFERVESDFSLAAKFFNGEQVEVNTKFLPWLIDNAPNYLNGYELFQFYHYAAKLAAVGKVDFISGLAKKGSGNVERPYFFRKLGLVRSGK